MLNQDLIPETQRDPGVGRVEREFKTWNQIRPKFYLLPLTWWEIDQFHSNSEMLHQYYVALPFLIAYHFDGYQLVVFVVQTL